MRQDPDRTLEAYDQIAPVYEAYSKKRQAYLDAVDRLVIQRLTPEMRLLDVGTGDGRRLTKIQTEVGLKNVVAIEPSPGMAKICRENCDAEVYESSVEGLDKFEIGKFNVVTALWNVMGHIPSGRARLEAFRQIATKLEPRGRILLDVNNRHNAPAYGYATVLGRLIIDTMRFDEHRGDAVYDWEIGDKKFKSSGHLFVPREMDGLLKAAGMKIVERLSVNYATGNVSMSPFKGQLFYVAEKE